MYCEQCGAKNNDTDMFCANCGGPLHPEAPVKVPTTFCSSCGASNSSDDIFCVECGEKMDSDIQTDEERTQLDRYSEGLNNQLNLNTATVPTQTQYNVGNVHPTQNFQTQNGQPQNVQSQYRGQVNSVQQQEAKEKKEGSKTPLLVLMSVCAVVLVGLIGVGVYLLLGDSSTPAVAEITPKPTIEAEATPTPTEKIEVTEAPVATEAPAATKAPEVTEAPVATKAPVEVAGEPQQQPRSEEPQRDTAPAPDTITRNDFVFLDSDTRLITTNDLDRLSAWQIRVARNELFARNHRKFTSKDMKEYFESQAWYTGTIDPTTFDDNRGSYMNSIEIKNMDFINAYEKAHGINQN